MDAIQLKDIILSVLKFTYERFISKDYINFNLYYIM